MTRKEFETDILPLSRTLYRYAFRFLLHKEEAEDAVQEVINCCPKDCIMWDEEG